MNPTIDLENSLLETYDFVVGIDEVGRGCLAGPVVVGGYLYSKGEVLVEGVRDSKVISKKKRNLISTFLKQKRYKISEKNNEYIDEFGISNAIISCIDEIMKYFETIEYGKKIIYLIDGYFKKKWEKDFKFLVDGDAKHYSISAASILAKVHRDEFMINLSKTYPEYGFDKHVGYATKLHRDCINKNGLTNIHRKGFCSSFLSGI